MNIYRFSHLDTDPLADGAPYCVQLFAETEEAAREKFPSGAEGMELDFCKPADTSPDDFVHVLRIPKRGPLRSAQDLYAAEVLSISSQISDASEFFPMMDLTPGEEPQDRLIVKTIFEDSEPQTSKYGACIKTLWFDGNPVAILQAYGKYLSEKRLFITDEGWYVPALMHYTSHTTFKESYLEDTIIDPEKPLRALTSMSRFQHASELGVPS